MKKILIISNDPELRGFISETLKYGGFSTVEASSLKGALTLVRDEYTELVYLDLMLPEEKDGYAVMKKIIEERPSLPVVILAENNNAEAAAKAIKLGAEEYLAKDVVKDSVVLVAVNIFKKTELEKKELLSEQLPRSLKGNSNILESGLGLLEVGKRAASEYEKIYLLKVLGETGGNKTRAAKLLKIDYKTLFNKMKEYGIALSFLLLLF